MRRLVIFLAITTVHFALNELALLYGAAAIIATFDGKGSAIAALLGYVAMSVLGFPLMFVPTPHGLGTAGQYALLATNSMLWGAAGVWVWSRRTGWRRRAPIGG